MLTQIAQLLMPVALTIHPQALQLVQPDRAIDTGPDAPLTEPMVAINPRDPSHLVVGLIVAPRADDDPWSCGVMTSHDTGTTWTFHDFGFDRCIDPWVAFTPKNEILFIGIQLDRDVQGDERFHLLGYRSVDGGISWTPRAQSLGRALDHVMLARGGTNARDMLMAGTGMRRDRVGEPWRSVFVSESTDDGRSFEPVADLRPGDLALNLTGIAVLPSGALVASFFDYQRNVDGFGTEGMLAAARAWLYRSTDRVTFGDPILIDDRCASGIEGSFPGYPTLAADTTRGRFGGRLYHACVRSGFNGVSFAYSADGGETWSRSHRIDDPTLRRVTAHVRTPMLATNASGIVAAAWYDRRHDPDAACQDLYAGGSVDGGSRLMTPMRISTETSCPGAPDNGRAGRSWPMGGDYSSLAASPDSSFHIVWADARSAVFRLHHAQFMLPEREAR